MTETGFYRLSLLLKEGWEVKGVKVDHNLKKGGCLYLILWKWRNAQ